MPDDDDDDGIGKTRQSLRLAEDTFLAFWFASGLWYWKRKEYRHELVFYPLVTLFGVWLLGGNLVGILDLTQASEGLTKGIVVIVATTAISQIIERGWPRPTDGVSSQDKSTRDKKVLVRNLGATVVVAVVLTAILHDVLSLTYVFAMVGKLVPASGPSLLYTLEAFIEAGIAAVLALFLLWVAEKVRKSKSGFVLSLGGRRKCVFYLASLWMVCTAVTFTLDRIAF